MIQLGSEEIEMQTNEKQDVNVIEKIVNLKVNKSKENQYNTFLFTTQQYFKEAVRISKSTSEMDKEVNPILKFTPDTFNINEQMLSGKKTEKPTIKPIVTNKQGFVTYFREMNLFDLKSRDAIVSRQALDKEILDKAYKTLDKENMKQLSNDYIKTRYVRLKGQIDIWVRL